MLLARPLLLFAVALVFAAGPVACAGPPPAKAPDGADGVPANSLSDARLHGEDETDTRTDAPATKEDPTQPYLQRVGDAPEAPAPSRGGKVDAHEAGGGGKASKAECDRLMDRYLELEIANNPQLQGLPPEVMEEAKRTARQKHGEAPCTATRAQYRCAMNAGSTTAWQSCLK